MAAVATVPQITPELLREQATAARAESERLRQRSKDKLAEAHRLEREAEALALAIELAPDVNRPSSTELFVEELSVWLRRQRKPKSSTEIADHFGVSAGRVRNALSVLVERGECLRMGLKRGTRYRALKDGESVCQRSASPDNQRWHERIRDVAIRLETFTLAEAVAEVPDVADATVYRWLGQLVEDGLLSVERVGNRNLYAYEPPEVVHIGTKRRVDPSPSRRRGSTVVEGTGRGDRRARSDVRKMVAAAEAQGAEVKPQKHGYRIEKDGEVIGAIPRTPSDHRSLKNARANLKRSGIDA